MASLKLRSQAMHGMRIAARPHASGLVARDAQYTRLYAQNHLRSTSHRSGMQFRPDLLQKLNPSSASRRGMSQVASMDNVAANRPIAYWLFGCAAMVGGMVVVGGITRITRSGLSMVNWKPHGGLPPQTQEEWEAEFEEYKKFPEYQQRKNMDLDEFKQIFFWEYSHRMLGRVVGLAFAGPLAYFAIRKRIPAEFKKRLGVLLGLGATQGGIGWWMVKSGLQDPNHNRKEIRVSPYRLATHLGMAFTTYGLLVWSGMDLLSPKSKLAAIRETMDPVVLKKAATVRKFLKMGAGTLGITILSGAFVAGIDAGMAYNTFPKMDGEWIPDTAFEMEPFYKNFFENTALVQFDHRVLGLTTLTGITGSYALARNAHVWKQLPSFTKKSLTGTAALAALQVSLGITTLVHCVPIPVAITHQFGALALMSSTLVSLHALRFAKASPALKRAVADSMKSKTTSSVVKNAA